MILQALYQLAEREELMADPDFELKPVAWLVRVGEDGRLLGIEPNTREEVTVGKNGKEKRKTVARNLPVPRELGRTSGERAFLLIDKAEYVFGIDPDGKRDAEALKRRAALFRDRASQCLQATQDQAVGAILKLLEKIADGSQQVQLAKECKGNDLFGFVYAPDVDLPVVMREAVRRYWKSLRSAEAGSQETSVAQCLVSGIRGAPVDVHPQVKRVPGGSTSGVSLISFNSSAFESYGLKGNGNAPICREASEACATALNRLLHPAWPDPHRPGEFLAKRNVQLSSDTVVCFWGATESQFEDALAPILEADPAAVSEAFHSIWQGRPSAAVDPSAFYGLVLAGAQGRATVRQWIETTVGDASTNLSRYFDDIRICRNCPAPKKGGWPPAFPLNALLESVAVHGKRENVPGPLAARFMTAVISGGDYPLALLEKAIGRARAEIGKDDWIDLARRDARMGLVKAVLRRGPFNRKVTETMDENEQDVGYLFGRLMAVVERMQQLALGDVNATVIDRFFSGASATPAAVFPRLLKNFRHHARKASDSDKTKGSAIFLEKQLDTICSGLSNFPAYLNLQQQGLFLLGYHHQRHAFFSAPKEAKQIAPHPAAEAVGAEA